MGNLRKATLSHNKKQGTWQLKDDKTNKVLKSFETKSQATKSGVLEKALGKEGGSVKIKKLDGKFEEERTYPGTADPKQSQG